MHFFIIFFARWCRRTETGQTITCTQVFGAVPTQVRFAGAHSLKRRLNSKCVSRASPVSHLLFGSQQVFMVPRFPSVLQLLPECQLRRIRKLGASASAATWFVCGSGQPLSLRRGGEHRRATGRKAAADAVWPGDGAIGCGTDPGQQPASQGASGTDERGAARPAGQGNASGWDQRSRKRQPIFGRGVFAGVPPAVCAGGGQPRGGASGRGATAKRSVELGGRAGGTRRLDGGVWREAVSTGSGTRGVEPGAQSDCANAAEWTGAVGVSREATEVASAARRSDAPAGPGEAGENANGGEAAVGESFFMPSGHAGRVQRVALTNARLPLCSEFRLQAAGLHCFALAA